MPESSLNGAAAGRSGKIDSANRTDLLNDKPTPHSCCPPAQGLSPEDIPGYRIWPFVRSWMKTAAGAIPQVETSLRWSDHFGRWQMRWGLGRNRYRIFPGLYAVGTPDAESPVLVTANYKMSFDAVRRELIGLDAWILVLDTRGINVWCAAGKGTFGTAEIVRRVRQTGLEKIVTHRILILPQLGAPGVAAHQVKKESGFRVIYGPVQARDIVAFLAAGHQTDPEMRRVTFSTLDRLVLTPVELTGMFRIAFWAALLLLVLGSIGSHFFSLGTTLARGGSAWLVGIAGLVTGAVVTPILLPWLPRRAFAFKGWTAGMTTAVLLILLLWSSLGWVNALALLLAVPAVSSFCAMNFTGSTTFTSPSGVEKEMRRAIPLQAAALVAAGIIWVAGAF
jgi:hypothetical protein